MARPRKPQYPITLEQALRLLLPKKRPEDRMRIFREWARVNLATKLWKQPTEEEFDAEWNLWCSKPFDRSEQLDSISGFLKNFIPQFAAVNRKKRAKTAADKRWAKKNTKPS